MKNNRSRIKYTTILATLLLANGVWALAPWVPSGGNNTLVTTLPSGLPNDADFQRGLLNVKKYDPPGSVGKAMGNNSNDDTESIQAALYAAYQYNLVCYFPTGTYMITNTLDCDQKVDNNRRYTYQLLGQKGSPVSNRPVIRLKNYSSGFGNTSSPKPILKIWGRESDGAEKPGDCFNNVVRGIDIWTGTNAGAAGMYFAGAQGCSVEDLRIDATGGYCGFLKSIGVNGGYYNIEIEGGKHAIYVKQHNDPVKTSRTITDQFPVFAGCRFYNQTSEILWTDGRSPYIFVGFHIKKANAPAFKSKNNWHEQGGNLTLMDGVIELTNNGLAIDNSNTKSRSVYIKDVYLKNASVVVSSKSPTDVVTGTSNGWTEVLEYGRTLTNATKNGRNLINGAQSSETPEISSPTINLNVSASSVPSANSLISNHIWDEASFPAFDDSGVFDAVVDGGLDNTWNTDVTSALNNMLLNNDMVFLPKGRYKISGTITVPGNTKFFGVSKAYADLKANPNAWDPATEKYILKTGTSKDDAPLVSNIWLNFKHVNKGKMVSVFHWTAGRNSMVRNIFAWDYEWGGNLGNPQSFTALNKKIVKFSGNGGGRMFGICFAYQQTASGSAHDSNRLIYVTGTTEPLNFYGYNIERQLGFYQSEFNGASNINVFGGKTEGDNPKAAGIPREDLRPMIAVVNCDNVIIGSVGASVSGCKDGWVRVINSTNVLCANITTQNHQSSLSLIKETNGSSTYSVNAGTYAVLGTFKRGSATLNDFDSAPPQPSDLIEIETLTRIDSSRDGYSQSSTNTEASNGAFTWYGSNATGDYVTFDINVPTVADYQIYVGVGTTPTSGIFQLKVDGTDVGGTQDLYSTGYLFEERNVGSSTFATNGNKQFRFEVTGTNGSNSIMRLDYIRLEEIVGSNTNPVLSPIADVTMDEGTTAIANLSATDADGDAITLTATGVPPFGTLTDNGDGTGTISFSPGFSESGSFSITAKADDGKGGIHYKAFTLTVNDVNRNPVLAPIAAVTMNEGETVSTAISATDADDDTIMLTAYSLPSFGTLTDNGGGTGNLSFSPGSSGSGTYAITVKADDGRGGVHYKAFDLTVNNVNRVPTISSITDTSVDENATIVINISSSDLDGDSITLSVSNMPTFGILTDNGDGTGAISLSPGYDDAGVYSLTVSADDGNGGAANEAVSVTVNNVNRAPSIAAIAGQNVEEESTLVVNASATDPDTGDSLSFSAAGLPSFGTLTDNGDGTASISFNPMVGDFGSYSVTVTVDDGNTTSNTDASSFLLTVDPTTVSGIAFSNDFSTGFPSDTFTGSNTSFFAIANGELSVTDPTKYKSIYVNSTDVPNDADDYKIVSRMKKGTKSGYKGPAIRFRYSGSQSFYEMHIRKHNGSDLRLTGPTNATTIASWDIDMDPEVYNTYSISVNGTNVSIYINNNFVGNATIGGLTGQTGLSERADEAFWDYYRVITNGEPDYIEDFNDTFAQDWVLHSNEFEITDTGGGDYVLKQTAGSSWDYARYNAVVSVDENYSVALDGRVTGTRVKAWDSPNLLLKYKSTGNFFTIYVYQDTVTGVRDVKLKKLIGGVSTDTIIASSITSVSDVAEWHTIEAKVDGEKLSIWINGVQEVTDYIDADLLDPVFDADTQCGVRTPTSNVSVEFDNFKFYDEYK